MSSPHKLLMIFVAETDMWEQLPLYEAIVRRLRQLDVAGATVLTGTMGFGSHQKMHRKRLFGVSDDRPITICVAESENKLRAIVPEIRSMLKEGLILLLDAERLD